MDRPLHMNTFCKIMSGTGICRKLVGLTSFELAFFIKPNFICKVATALFTHQSELGEET